ncbi:hypothetical protein AAZX31_08G335600 [Glycine max]
MLAMSWRLLQGRLSTRAGLSIGVGYLGLGLFSIPKYLVPNWQRPKGIDSRFVVHNVKDLELLVMHNRTYCAEIAYNVSTRKRKEIVECASQLDVVVTNKRWPGCAAMKMSHCCCWLYQIILFLSINVWTIG